LITAEQLEALASPLSHTDYGQYLLGLLDKGKKYLSEVEVDASSGTRSPVRATTVFP
jgi:hypothetical protein